MNRRFCATISFLIVLFLLGSTNIQAQKLSEFLFGQTLKNPPKTALDKASEAYLDSLIQNTPLEEKIGQLFFVPAQGQFTNRDSRTFKELEKMITDYHVGGIIFMRGDIYGQAIMTNKLQRMSKFPLWISQDMEFGA
ncbi:MAG TPA: hypothetical protein DD671_00170, partial [Balneolaceae bacterium]|nr:hypothetical protein [Balneolaceae bacterium]